MEPKFQSSFIPKGPVAASTNRAPAHSHGKGILGFLATTIFTIAVLLCAGIFGYNWYLSYHISQVGMELDAARAQVDAESLREIIRLDDRIISTERILDSHVTISPLFSFLEGITLQSVRYTDFNFATTDEGLELRMGGQARGYSAVALQAEAFSESQYLQDPSFSDLRLDEEGNVVFSVVTKIDPSLVSYKRIVGQEASFFQPDATVEEEPIVEEESPQIEGESQATTTDAVSEPVSSPQTDI